MILIESFFVFLCYMGFRVTRNYQVVGLASLLSIFSRALDAFIMTRQSIILIYLLMHSWDEWAWSWFTHPHDIKSKKSNITTSTHSTLDGFMYHATYFSWDGWELGSLHPTHLGTGSDFRPHISHPTRLDLRMGQAGLLSVGPWTLLLGRTATNFARLMYLNLILVSS